MSKKIDISRRKIFSDLVGDTSKAPTPNSVAHADTRDANSPADAAEDTDSLYNVLQRSSTYELTTGTYASALDELWAKANTAYPNLFVNKPRIFVYEKDSKGTPLPVNALVDTQDNCIYLHEKLLSDSSSNQLSPEQLKAVVAHEMGHIALGTRNTALGLASNHPEITGITAAVATGGSALAAMSGKKLITAATKYIHEHEDDRSYHKRDILARQKPNRNSGQPDEGKRNFMKGAIAAGAALFMGGSTYHWSKNYAGPTLEMMADQIAVELTGDPKSLKDALKILHKEDARSAKSHAFEAIAQQYGVVPITHGSLEERLKNIDRIQNGKSGQGTTASR